MEDIDINARYKERLLGVLNYCIRFFDKHNIKWFIACGSAIGAVRHNGMIPWDDDIDIYMPRTDYNKLISIRDEMLCDGYRFIYIQDEGYPLAFGKVMDNNTTVWQQRRFPFNFGCYVDVFPLDLTDIGMMSFGKKWRQFRNLYMCYRAKISQVSLKGVLEDIKAGRFDSFRVILMKIVLLFKKRKDILKELLIMEASWNKTDGDRYVSFTEAGMYMFPKKWFEDYTMMSFEDMEVRVSKYYDEYLTYIYGDYMTLPPENQRKGEGVHEKLYVNTERSLPLSCIKK